GPSGVTAGAPVPDPLQQKALIDQIRAQLGSNLADALAAQEQLQQSLRNNTAQQQDVQGQITVIELTISDLDAQIATAVQQETILSGRIDTERAQLGQRARALYVAPTSILVILGEATSLSDLLTRVADLKIAGSRAGDIKASLANDLASLQQQQQIEQAARDAQDAQRVQLATELTQLQALHKQQEKSLAQLQIKIAQTQSELY